MGFFENLKKKDWIIEDKYKFDASKEGFVIEWETGNISSSHRSINRMIKGMLEGTVAKGVLVLPSRAMYPYLTDRVGNFQELEPYLIVWEALKEKLSSHMLTIIEIEHDELSEQIPPLPKGKDGNHKQS